MDCNISLFFRSSLGLCAERPHHNARGLIVDSFSQVECRDLFFEIWLHAPCAWFPGKWFAWQIASLCVARSAGPTKSWQTQRRSQRVEGVKDVQVRTNTFAWEVVGGGGVKLLILPFFYNVYEPGLYKFTFSECNCIRICFRMSKSWELIWCLSRRPGLVGEVGQDKQRNGGFKMALRCFFCYINVYIIRITGSPPSY